MAKQKRELLPLTTEDGQRLLEMVQGAEAPLPASQIARQVQLSRKVTEADVAPLLDEFVQAGTLHLIPARTGKGKPQYWGRDSKAVVTESLLAVLGQSESPLTAKELMKHATLPVKLSEAELVVLLDEAVGAGHIRAFPGTKGKTRYWDRDPAPLLRQAVLAAMEEASGPVADKELLKSLSAPVPTDEATLQPVLEELIESGELHRFPPATAKGKPIYWREDGVDWARTVLRRLVEQKGPQAEAALKKAVKWLTSDEFATLLDSLLTSGEVFRHPPLGKIKQALFGVQPPRPEPYLREVGVQLTKTVALLRSIPISDEQLRRALVQLVEETGVTFRNDATLPAENAVDLLALMKQIEPGAERGALVGVRDLRRAAQCSKDVFDQTVMELSRQGSVSLHRHDFPASLSEEERNDLVRDATGTYYVGIALRQNRW
ncbi:hypothetical protein [Planctomicrobium piriforme]|uniref:Uncharacterized protein n=1 Tax=Planctomicrobium piriforme TaxID=1576369 RepID=A0A1I3IG20_9PLAN|nr:hypothetical protein [Planctomicrobium piriforme]SFI46743.1 hypothetical protein SAMN05421753_109103 [Planctomicrobium piriforme]